VKVASSVILARRKSLAELLEDHRYLPLAEVCARLDISPATARRDLRALARDQRLTRTYGGALSTFDATYASFADRRDVDRDAKAQVARKARRLIKPDTTCFFDSGTTIFALAEALYREPVVGLRAITNSLPVAEMLGRQNEIEVHLLGGRFLQRQSILLGAAARRSARLWKFDLVFLGAEGFSQGGIWASEPEVAAFQKTLITQARKVVVCAHAAKLGRETGIFLAPWTSKFQLVTDVSPAVRSRRGLPV
jgi:DeoR/GlpR family transcriptional regulator of sugar metabolism